MLITGSYENTYLILRSSIKGKISFFTGTGRYSELSRVWTPDRRLAAVLTGDLEEIQLQAKHIPCARTDRVFVLPQRFLTELTRWVHDDGARTRRALRQQRLDKTQSEVRH
jgi:hypothetical protein